MIAFAEKTHPMSFSVRLGQHSLKTPPALFVGKRKKMLAFGTNVKDVRGSINPSVVFFSVSAQENDIAKFGWEQYHTRVDSEQLCWRYISLWGFPRGNPLGVSLHPFFTQERMCPRGMSANGERNST